MTRLEQIARLIDPSSWRVLDSYLEQAKRKYAGQDAGYDPEAFKDRASLAIADQIIALDAVPGEDEVLRALEVFHGSSCAYLRECWSETEYEYEYDAMSAALTAAAKVRGE